jgi:hypothetical protein
MAPDLAGLSPARLAILVIVGLIAVLAAGRALPLLLEPASLSIKPA